MKSYKNLVYWKHKMQRFKPIFTTGRRVSSTSASKFKLAAGYNVKVYKVGRISDVYIEEFYIYIIFGQHGNMGNIVLPL